ncbi:TPA: hypothetical protein U2L47_001342 [Citrobacter koseri]|uniref:tail fiber/spike domain-containing protein n=1 Tax=Citrobacter koseri TaxID=545 RepID=UPI001904AFFC|nr:hypothetical protein [Citrobacter koseri]EKW5656366.1 hypothetical protein [Citrobacter koseri]MBJ8807884.1 hypothetical protein [Citrobacter koseri]WOI96841.1 hypothetical protein R1158_12960 [Citrobacter koseri]HCT9897775.1 hypothetical protein [Citrobacter koseri]HEM6833830.1 hypothetical protein [Citrobacter koseri]
MTTYNTKEPLGSASAKILYDNAQNFDHLSNDQENELWPDRFGKNRLTWHGMEERYKTALANLGLNPVGTFQGGAVINSAGDIIQDETTGAWYRWDDLTTLPKTVPPGSTPDSSGGTGVGKWLAVDVSDVLRRELALPTGAEQIGYGYVTVAERLSYDVYFTGGSGATIEEIQAFIDANEGCTIQFPPGDYDITDWLFVPANTKLKGAQEISIKSHNVNHPEYTSIIDSMFSAPGITRFNLKGAPTKYIVTDVVEATDDASISAGITLSDENSGLENILIAGWRELTDSSYERPNIAGSVDAGATPCFDMGIFIPAISGCSVKGVAVIGYFSSGYACLYLDASRSYLNNGSGNTFNIDDRLKSNSMCDLTVQDCFFWSMDYNTPTQNTGAVSAYGIKLKGTDRDIRDLTKYPTVSGAASNWIWGGHGTSDQFYINTVARGIYFDASLRTFNGDTRLSDTTTGNNGYPTESMAGRGSKIFFTNCTFRLGNIYLNRVTNFNMVNCYGEAGTFTQTNLTGRVTVVGGDILQSYQSVTLPNVDGSTPSVPYDMNTSPMFFSYGSGKNDRFQLFHASPSNVYFRPHFDNKIANGYYDGTTRWAWSNTYTVQLTTASITCFGTANSVNFVKPPRLPSFTTAGRPALGPVDAGAQILDTTLGYAITWTGSAWKNGAGTIV